MKSMKKLYALLVVSLWMAPAARAELEVPDPAVLEQENRLKNEAEHRIQNDILDRVLGKGRSSVLVNINIGMESKRHHGSELEQKAEKKNPLTTDQDFLLPWVPAPRSVTKEEVPKEAKIEVSGGNEASVEVKTVIKGFEIIILHDVSVKDNQKDLVREAITSAYERYNSVLKIVFRPLRFAEFGVKTKIVEGFWDFFKPQYLLPAFIALLLLLFLFGPLYSFLRAYLRALRERGATEIVVDSNSKVENKGGEEGGAGAGGGGAAALGELTEEEKKEEEEDDETMKKYVPFTYIIEENANRLLGVFRKEPPDVIALVLSYLKPELVKIIMTSLPPELQAKVALEFATVRQMTQEQVMCIDADIKEKIDFVIGGLDALLGVLEEVDGQTRENILEYLKVNRPAVYGKIRSAIISFDDIPAFSNQAMQIIIRELKVENMARSLRGASPEILNKFMENMSQGAAALLKEEMEYGAPVSSEQIDDERHKIVELIKRLLAEGKIAIERKRISVFDSEEGESISVGMTNGSRGRMNYAVQVDPRQAFEYYYAATKAYENQKYDEAINLFYASLQFDPAMWQAYQYLGNTYYTLGQLNEAIKAYEEALKLNPADENIRQWIESLRHMQVPS